MPVCGTCQSAGRMAAGDKELLMRQIMEAGFAGWTTLPLFLRHSSGKSGMRFAITKRSVTCDQSMAAYEEAVWAAEDTPMSRPCPGTG